MENKYTQIVLKDYVFAIGYAHKRITDKRDYFVLDMTYDLDKLKSMKKKFNVSIDILDIDKKYNKEFDVFKDIDNSMEKLLIHFGELFYTSTGTRPKNLVVVKGYTNDNALSYYCFMLKKKK